MASLGDLLLLISLIGKNGGSEPVGFLAECGAEALQGYPWIDHSHGPALLETNLLVSAS